MSAILGRINLDGTDVHAHELSAAMESLAQYGRDGQAQSVFGNGGFGVQKLNLTTAAAQHLDPVQNADLLTVSDAILNNRDELLNKLGMSADTPCTDNDILLRSYAKWGVDCPRHIYGDYAFAVYDRTKQRLVLIRDHIGIRPLYWALKANVALFATDQRGILCWDDLQWGINQRAVARHIMGPARPAAETFWDGVNLVKPGTVVSIDRSGVSEHRWWDPALVPANDFGSTEDYVAEFRALMERIGDTYVATSGQIGSHISGGIDSCSVAAFAARALERRGRSLKAGYTWSPAVSERYPLGQYDERHNIARVARDFDFPVRYGQATGDTQHDYLHWPLEYQGIANMADETPVLKQAAADDIRVMLSGWGGDEAFSAHGVGFLANAIKQLRPQDVLMAMRFHTGGMRSDLRNTLRVFMQLGVSPLMPTPIYCRLAPFADLHAGGAFPSRIIQAERVEAARFNGEDVRLIGDPNRYLVNLLNMGHLAMRMETWATWSSSYGFQYRYPLVDRELLEFVLGMPKRVFFGDGKSRFLARAATEDLLPKRLSKHDQFNEMLRDDNHVACWRLLKRDLGSGAFDKDSDWLDMHAFKHAISQVPQDAAHLDLPQLAKLLAATRIYHMEQRMR